MSDIQVLAASTLKLLLCGQTIVNVAEWRRTTVYIEGYTKGVDWGCRCVWCSCVLC